MKSVSSNFALHLLETVTTLTTIWRVIRRDNVEFYFTDHDVTLSFDDGDGEQNYLAENGYSRTAISNNVGLSVDNMDMQGLFSASGFIEDELRIGLFDFAEVRVSAVNWADTSQGAAKLRRGTIGEVSLNAGGIFVAELRGLTSPLSQDIVTRYQAECRTDLGSTTCKVGIKNDILARNLSILQFETFRIATLPLTGIDFVNIADNHAFNQGTLGIDTQSINNWTVISGKWDVTATIDGLSPQFGSQFLRGSEDPDQAQLRQDISLTLFGLDVTSVDAGNVTADFSMYRANTDIDDTGSILVSFLDAALAPIGTLYSSGTEEITPVDTWVIRSASAVAVPATTRHIRIHLTSDLITGSQHDSCFDNINLTLNDSFTTNPFHEIYENIMYECTIAGVTASSAPIFNETIGSKTTDGTAEVIAREAWTRNASIIEVIDKTNIRITVTDTRAIDDWFNYGGLIVESGANAGIVREIKSWVQTDGELELFIETPFRLYPGTKITVYRGCDKKSETCREIFGNTTNFQAEPFIPGTDVLGGNG